MYVYEIHMFLALLYCLGQCRGSICFGLNTGALSYSIVNSLHITPKKDGGPVLQLVPSSKSIPAQFSMGSTVSLTGSRGTIVCE